MAQNYVIFTPEGIAHSPGTTVIDISFTGDPIQDDEERFYQTRNAVLELDRVMTALEQVEPGTVADALTTAAVDLARYILENLEGA